MADKKKKGRRAYLSDYVMDVSGEYVYTGDYYEASAEKGDVQKLFKKVLKFTFLLVVYEFAHFLSLLTALLYVLFFSKKNLK